MKKTRRSADGSALRSGRKGRGFESRRLDQKSENGIFHSRIFGLRDLRRDSRVGAVLREQNALPYCGRLTKNLTAKDAIDDGGAGRAAKGSNPVASTKNSRSTKSATAVFGFKKKSVCDKQTDFFGE